MQKHRRSSVRVGVGGGGGVGAVCLPQVSDVPRGSVGMVLGSRWLALLHVPTSLVNSFTT